MPATGMVSGKAENLIDQRKLARSDDDFLQEVHPELCPVDMAVGGVVLAGTCQAPMDIRESCSAASAAAVKAAAFLARETIQLEPFRARVDRDRCRGQGKCVEARRHQRAIRVLDEKPDGYTVAPAEALRGRNLA